MEMDWILFGLAVELQLDLDLDRSIWTPAWSGLKLVALLALHSLYPIGREDWAYYSQCMVNSQSGEYLMTARRLETVSATRLRTPAYCRTLTAALPILSLLSL